MTDRKQLKILRIRPIDYVAATDQLTPATRGIWFDWSMWMQTQCADKDSLSGSMGELAVIGRCTEAEADRAVAELQLKACSGLPAVEHVAGSVVLSFGSKRKRKGKTA